MNKQRHTKTTSKTKNKAKPGDDVDALKRFADSSPSVAPIVLPMFVQIR